MCIRDRVEEIYGWRFQPGDKVTIHYYDGEEFFKTYEIAGVVKGFKDGLTNGWFLLPQQVLAETLPGVDLTDTFVVETREGQRDKVEEPLGEIVDAHPQLSMSTLRQQEAQSRDMWNQTILILVSIVLFLSLIHIYVWPRSIRWKKRTASCSHRYPRQYPALLR